MNHDATTGMDTTSHLLSLANPAHPVVSSAPPSLGDVYVPLEPESLSQIDVPVTEIENLILKQLFQQGPRTGRDIARQLQLPLHLANEVLQGLKRELYIAYKQTAGLNDYLYELREAGFSRAHQQTQVSTYCGAVPIGLNEYRNSVLRQSLRNVEPSMDDMRRAFADLTLSPRILGQIGQAIMGGRSLFLYGAPGNGKTSVAERMMGTLQGEDRTIWIPRALCVNTEVIRIFDQQVHQEVPVNPEVAAASRIDRRWIRIARPVVIVGGELTLEHLELVKNQVTGITEAPIQLKANCGSLVIDDFGRQKVNPTALLNRMIVPLEKGVDYLSMSGGRCICVPFDAQMVFSTNLRPEDLWDEAFMRRLKYKIEFPAPSAEQFKNLFDARADRAGFEVNAGAAEHALQRLRELGQPLRFSHVDDLLEQARDFCRFMRVPLLLNTKVIDVAVHNHFASIAHPTV
ncbi:MAG: ATP-binding protein [Planctomycetales bacterium]|nr:ATP-binding protein [Planctomycetales bacterium]